MSDKHAADADNGSGSSADETNLPREDETEAEGLPITDEAAEGAERRSGEAGETVPSDTRPPLSGRTAYALAALSGILYAFACPGFDLWPLAFFSQVPVIVALKGQTPRRAAGLGWLAGFCLSVIAFYWLRGMLAVFSQMPPPVPALLMLALCAYQAGRMALCGLVYAHATRRGWPAGPVFIGAFAATELVFPVLFPWYYGACVHNALPLLQIAELGGIILVSIVLLTANLALAGLVERFVFGQRLQRVALAVGVLVPAAAGVFGVVRMGQIEAQQEAAESVSIAMIQGNRPLMKGKGARKAHTRLTAQAREKGVDLVLWSEGADNMRIRGNDWAAEVTDRVAKALKVPAIIGIAMKRRLPKGSRFKKHTVSAAVLTGVGGEVISRYDKQFLLMFGEYLPFGDTFPVLYDFSPNSSHLTPGTSLDPLLFGDHRLATTICYEGMLPSFVNGMMRHANADLMVNLTNDAWFGDTLEPWQHHALTLIRTVEQRRYLVRATNSGVSSIVDATGKVVVHGGMFVEEVVYGEARYLTGGTLYRTIGDIPWWLLSLVMIGLCVLPHRKRG